MLSTRRLDDPLPILRRYDFTSRPHQTTFDAIRKIHLSDRPVDPVLAHEQLRRRGTRWGHTTAPLFVHSWLQATYFPDRGDSYATIVLDNALGRRIVQAGVHIAQVAATGTSDGRELLDRARSQLASLDTAQYRDSAELVSA
jgi:replicative DNA helicase